MKINVTSLVDVSEILKRRGMGPSNGLRKYLASRVRLRSDPYVPKAAGTLKNTGQISPAGTTITYGQPYAHYQYAGKAMAGRAPKHYTGKTLQHHGAPMRGPHWDKRMMIDHRSDIERDIAAWMKREANRK